MFYIYSDIKHLKIEDKQMREGVIQNWEMPVRN